MKAEAFLAALLLCIAACAPKAAPPAPMVGLDCASAFEALRDKIVGQPRLTPAPKDPTQPYRFYSSDDGKTSYLITEPDAPAHPAIMLQRAVGTEVKTTGCPYGDKARYDELAAYLDSLKTWTRK
ncbi:hypothetical protein [Phenylobacterium immobile]|uniref:hypothetical protein n=1 Tax=Phenylobacterium immobile TaxID=21 RepID=UPI000A921E39|nr:hypothetical protein [Phenylobacterium immobile]